MAKLTTTQRSYILQRLVENAANALRKKVNVKGFLPELFSFRASNGGYRSFEIEACGPYHHDKTNYSHYRVVCSGIGATRGIFNATDSCRAKEDLIKEFLVKFELPDSWYKAEYKAKRFKTITEFTDCMRRPKLTCVFPNDERALKKHKTAAKKKFLAQYDKAHEITDEVKADVMAINKTIQANIDDVILADAAGAKELLVSITKKITDEIL